MTAPSSPVFELLTCVYLTSASGVGDAGEGVMKLGDHLLQKNMHWPRAASAARVRVQSPGKYRYGTVNSHTVSLLASPIHPAPRLSSSYAIPSVLLQPCRLTLLTSSSFKVHATLDIHAFNTCRQQPTLKPYHLQVSSKRYLWNNIP